MKSRFLILGSIVTLIAISAIQAYLIYNTYELKKKTFAMDARNSIAKVYTTQEVDSLSWIYRNDFLNQLELYENSKISKSEVLKNLETTTREINKSFLKLYEEGIKKTDINFDVKIKVSVTDIIILDSLTTVDEKILDSQKDSAIFILGNNFSSKDAMLINKSTWQKELEDSKQFKDLHFKTQIYMNLVDWENVIIKELSVLLILSVLLFAFVIGLLSYSIHNLIKQKRLAEIKTDFINNITHELKTPLSTLAITTKTLTNKYAEGQTEIAKETIQVIDRQNKRLQNLIDQVVNNSVGYDEIDLSLKKFKTIPFLNDIINDYKITLNENVEIVRNFIETDEKIIADKFYLGTAILNLLSNAVKYEGTKIEISYSYNEKVKQHIILVSDNGIGISKRHQKLIFEKFFRVSEKDRHNYKGLGLGLYYSKQIIKAHKGILEVESKENEGSVFKIIIPKQ
ncbi:HAMP domain-containing sensor histidine kinase [uncultured Flavobacterium sp.]|uniref:sensor histidine kinase n=1 Tax=uncultured Flavobacterium sp. TaxID=165435 RepID=UPI0030C8114F